MESVARDAAFIRTNVIMPQIDAGKEVILAVHSYGGLPGAVAAKGLSKEERMADGKEGGIIGLIFICALVTRTGDSLLSILPGQVFDPWVIQYVSSADHVYPVSGISHGVILQDDGQLGVRNPKQVFYADVPSPQDWAAIDALRNQSRASLSTPGGPPAWSDAVYNERRSYFRTLDDQSIPAVAQKAFLDNSGVQWSVKNFHSSHSPFLSHPADLASWMVKEAAKFSRARNRHRLDSRTDFR